ncbi:glycerate kinase [Alkalibacterium sp. 20]|uniref:glycerate kinase n=1 Tax=Alkalibacterium sp. 20 TaxID=1798803 RepID=UPI0009001BE9|nr:glycerate kinase [Alkalibacterium sp. 20]OJF94667.1 hypothetical protein AX762_02025 [Alkalibacterium sp. 20]
MKEALPEHAVSCFPIADGGEGKFDGQSLSGKVPVGISRLAKQSDVPVILFAGKIEGDRVPIVDAPMTLDEAMGQGPALLEKAVKRTIRLIEFGKRMRR